MTVIEASDSRLAGPLVGGSDARQATRAAAANPAARQRLLLEVERRSLGGLYMHIPAWLLMAASTGLPQRHMMLVVLVTAFFSLNLAARVLLHPHFARLAAWNIRFAEVLLLSLLLSGSALWGLLLALLSWPVLQPSHEAIRLVVLAICAAGTMTLALSKGIRIGMPLLTFGPYVAALLLRPSIDSLFTALLALLFLSYVFVVSRIVQRDYWFGVTAHELLAQRAEELERLNITDALTQVHNRLHFDRVICLEWARAQRHGELVTVLIVDLDHFKKINDVHGHPFGDRCLQAAAAAMQREMFRPADLLARYGGEEFVVLLPGTDVAGSRVVAERLLASVGAVRLDSQGSEVTVTCSIGAATLRPGPEASWTTLLAEADAALYRAKAEGRNRVVVANRWQAGDLVQSA